MKAAVYHDYGPPKDVLGTEDVAKPTPADDEVLIRVRAAAANPLDYHFMSGTYIMRPMTGFRRPKPTVPGCDLAGDVEAVGKSVKRLKQGNSVFGGARRAFAEYVCASENKLALKPANLTFEQAAAIPVAGLTALQGLRDKGRVQPGQKVLINGAAGGVGAFAVQIARWLGAEVTGVCSTRNVDLVRSIGAKHVVDYTADDFARSEQRYDVIVDCVGNRPLSEYRRVMTPKGTFVAVGVRPAGRWIGPLPYLLKLLVSSRFVSQNVVFFIASIGTNDLTVLKELIEANEVTPIIDKRYTLNEAGEAIRYLKEGHARGKVVITVEHSTT
ncbi:MAG: NAD(P)-dependent alcohol dehydrogenase [Planctomycetes bacterium]|nr:NAD(P)-dependent alcohol dehydrogenase [Planctomycetota bacterium]MBI3847906.1 NAD(P)-dependent alcohol dehydrogenase [Planctomycetota bacterium]